VRFVVVLVALVACGRSGFDPVDGGGSSSDGASDGPVVVVHSACTVPSRPDVSSPRITLGCDQIVATTEILNGGVIRFDCATGVKLGAPLLVNKDTIIDGNGVVFDGQGITQILHVNNNARLTLLDVTVTRGATNGNGAGVVLENGGLVAFDSTFTDNHGPTTGPSFGGGAICAQPTLATVEIYGGTFRNNTSANAGAIQVFADLTVVNSVFDSNVATGSGGNASMGGDGGAIRAAGSGNVTLCGDVFTSNLAGYAGGALFRVSTSMMGIDRITEVAIDGNRGMAHAGATYIQASQLTMRRVSSTNNLGAIGGGFWLQNMTGLDAENLSVVANRADNGTGAGMFLGAVSGRIAFSTIADNAGSCSGCVGAAIMGTTNIDMEGTVIVDNTAPATPVACDATGINLGANFQWPNDLPLCAQGASVTDPLLQTRASVTGPAGTYVVRRPAAGSPVIGAAVGCPTEDILGNPRAVPCAAGAVEP
jgi:hypothetical protein